MKKFAVLCLSYLVLISCTPSLNFMNQNVNGSANSNSNTYPCPQYAPTPKGWCRDGVIIQHEKDDYGCQLPATCEKNVENLNTNEYYRLKKEGEMCGGIAGFQCEKGLTCNYEGSSPDAAGTCLKADDPRSMRSQLNELCGGFINRQCHADLVCIFGTNGSDVGTCARPNPKINQICVQMITKARDPRTGDCLVFDSPCETPLNWEFCN